MKLLVALQNIECKASFKRPSRTHERLIKIKKYIKPQILFKTKSFKVL